MTPAILGGVGDLALAVTPAILLTSSLTSHSAALASGAYLAIGADWLHFLAASAWVGALASLVIVLPVALASAGRTVDGDGAAGIRLVPRPADLRVHMAAGHTDGQLLYWVSFGMSGTAMPAWRDELSEEEQWDVINHIRTFATR